MKEGIRVFSAYVFELGRYRAKLILEVELTFVGSSWLCLFFRCWVIFNVLVVWSSDIRFSCIIFILDFLGSTGRCMLPMKSMVVFISAS